ncbi:MucB/RseB C-terminal domain-containing protein [Marinobacter changyiensis]|uniref:MucB/RseB C-terminal domain-containing protein n=1 Tax=Marinobacter changyiensis TaxID=2604091 RepID=UPI0015D3F9BA|nr:MucB/RseB C-terminal domain-containing protein [Marinobacter changyiensis]
MSAIVNPGNWCHLIAAIWLLSAMVMPSQVAAEQPDSAEGWLMKLGPALNMTSYRGVFVYDRGDRISTMQVAHRYHNGQVEERLVQQDGENGEIVRKGMKVFCVLPDHGRIQLDQIIPSGPFAEAFSNQLVPISRWYLPETLEDDRVAGYPVVVVALNARDQHRYSYRLWLEKKTGLLVKSHVRSDDEVLERFHFTSLEITDELHDSEFEIQLKGPEVKYELQSAAVGKTKQRMDGWRLKWRPEGFVPAAAPGAGQGRAIAFSDGLASFSVFVEAAVSVNMPTGASRIGATTAYMRKVAVGDRSFLVTVVGEIPPSTAMRVAESVDIEDAFVVRREQP